MPRRRSHRQARERILEAAGRLFYREGVRGVGVDTIAAEAGVTKRTLYYHFPSKESLVAAYLKARDGPTRARLVEFASARGPLPGDRILGTFDFLERWFSTEEYCGCPFVNAVAEHGEIATAVGAISREHKRAVEDWFCEQAAQGGAPHPRQLGAQLTVIFEGAMAYALVHKNAAAAELARAVAQSLLTAAGVPVSFRENPGCVGGQGPYPPDSRPPDP